MSQAFPSLSEVEWTHGQQTLLSYIVGTITVDQALMTFQESFGGTDPVQRIKEILETPDEPLPSSPAAFAVRDDRKKHPWSQLEDQRLIAGIHRFGVHNWGQIASFVGNNRTRAQTSQRWQRGLDPRICRDPWTKELDEKLVNLVDEYGVKSWIKVAKALGNRSDVQCRYRYKQVKAEMLHSKPQVTATNQSENKTNADFSALLDKICWESGQCLSRPTDIGSIGSSFFDLPW
jgi:hypothetical protein